MGTCKICGKPTRFHYPLCWTHYYFNIYSFRFWLAFFLTIVWEYLINFPIITKEGLMIIMMNALFNETNVIWFFIGAIIIEIIIFIPSLIFFNYFVYRLFYSKNAIIKLN